MLYLRIILCFTFCIVCQSGNATGSDAVVVELQSGQRIRAHSIGPNPAKPDQVLLTVGNDQIRIQRVVSWNRVNRLNAPPAMLVDLKVPEHVKVVNQSEKQVRELNLTLTPDQAEKNTAEVRNFLHDPPPPPIPDLPSPSPFGDEIVLLGGANVPCDVINAAGPGIPCGAPCLQCFGPMIIDGRGRLRCDPGVVVGVRDQYGFSVPNVPELDLPRRASREQTEPRELLVTARAFNRNGLADWNSLEVSIQGRSASGQPCLVRGSLKCSLWVRRVHVVRAYAETYFEEPLELALLGQWSQFVDGSNVDANGIQKIVLSLPPRSSDHNLTMSQFGLLAVELDIPGQGRLATSSEPISLRQTGPIRNRSTVDFGASLLPGQSVSEGTFDAGYWQAPLSGLRPDSRRFTVQP